MPRRPRRDAPGLVHHVVARGIDRRFLFADDDDRLDLLMRLSSVLPNSGTRCLAWALMDNHFHLVLRTEAVPLARSMARVLTGYALRFNRRHGHVGHLFQGRYYSRPVVSDPELIAVIAYVHRNPLAAGVVASVQSLEEHPWTGHGALLGRAAPWPFHAVDAALEMFGSSIDEARRSVRFWIEREEPSGSALPEATTGSAAGQRPGVRPSQPAGHVDDLIDAVCRHLGIRREDLAGGRRTAPVAAGRAAIACIAARRGWSLVRLGPRLGVSPAALYQAIGRGEDALREWPELADLC